MPHAPRLLPANSRREGFALVSALLIILVLSIIGLGAGLLAGSEKRCSFAECVHARALCSADAGGECAINFLRLSADPPLMVDTETRIVNTVAPTTLEGSQQYAYACRYLGQRPKPGWGIEYLDYDYAVDASGASASEGRSDVALVISRLFYQEGY
jgi:Tfp pilus assembly protein PilX